MTVVYNEGRDMVVPDALSRLSVKLHNQRELEEEKQAFAGVVLPGLDDAELDRLREEVHSSSFLLLDDGFHYRSDAEGGYDIVADRFFKRVALETEMKAQPARLVYTPAYHPSADGQSERVNPKIEVPPPFYVDAM